MVVLLAVVVVVVVVLEWWRLSEVEPLRALQPPASQSQLTVIQSSPVQSSLVDVKYSSLQHSETGR